MTSRIRYSLANSRQSSVQEEGDLGADLVLAAFLDRILGTAVALPVYRLCVLLVGEGVDVYLVRYHECGVEAQTEVTDDLDRSLVLSLYLSRKSVAPENAIWCDVLLHLVRRHTKTVIDELQCFLLRVDDDLNLLSYIRPDSSYSPIISSLFSFVIASQPLEISSRTKMSWSEYSHFLIIGKIFSLLIERLPVRLLIMNNSFLFFSKKVKRIFTFRFVIWFGNTGADLLPV